MLPAGIITFTVILATVSISTGERVYPGDPGEVKLATALDHVSDSLHCFQDILQDSLHVSRKCGEDVERLTNTMLQTKVQLDKQENIITAMKDDVRQIVSTAIRDLQENLDAKNNENEGNLLKIRDLQENLDVKNNENVNNLLKVETCTQDIKTLKKEIEDKQKTTLTTARECMQPQLQEIKSLVHDYTCNKDWGQLRSGLEAVLDHSSEEYIQLQKIESANEMFDIGRLNHTQLASLLLCGGLPVDTAMESTYTMLNGAALSGHMQLVKLLLDHGADVNKRTDWGRTSLMFAAHSGYVEVAKVLVQAGADITARDNIGYTALDYAKKYMQSEVVQYLKQLPH